MQTAEFPSRVNVSMMSSQNSSKLASVKTDTTRQNRQLLHDQVEKLKGFDQKISNIVTKIGRNKQTCQQTIANLKTQISDLDNKVSAYRSKTISSAEQQQYRTVIKNLQGIYLSLCKDRVRIANEINIKALRKVDIEDKKSNANQIFKWILVAIYNEPDNKFFWPNFKEQAFQNDKGKDFIERLGKVPANALRQQQKIKTETFLTHYNQYKTAPEAQSVMGETDKIYQIAGLFKKSYEVSTQIKNNEKLIEKHKESTMEKDQEYMRWAARSQALKDRIHINESYLKVLTQTEQKLQTKITSYQEIVKSSQKLQVQFNDHEWNPSINVGTEHKGNCQCMIF